MIIISVDQPIGLVKSGSRPACYFKRELVRNESLNIDLEKIISVLHVLYCNIPHVINIQHTL